jgi:hypothetical protein
MKTAQPPTRAASGTSRDRSLGMRRLDHDRRLLSAARATATTANRRVDTNRRRSAQTVSTSVASVGLTDSRHHSDICHYRPRHIPGADSPPPRTASRTLPQRCGGYLYAGQQPTLAPGFSGAPAPSAPRRTTRTRSDASPTAQCNRTSEYPPAFRRGVETGSQRRGNRLRILMPLDRPPSQEERGKAQCVSCPCAGRPGYDKKVGKPSRVRIGFETVIALAASALGVLTMFWRDWIEALAGWDLDHHNGSLEWLIVAVLLAVSAVLGVAELRHWRLRAAVSEIPT